MIDRNVLAEAHRYWFGELKSPADMPADKLKLWFGAPVEIDNEIREKFGRYLDEAKATDWDLGTLSRIEQMGLIVLLDQFPRHIFRGKAEQFAYDPNARAIASTLIAGGVERFYGAERTFLFLPLEHSEDMLDQDRSVWLFAGLVQGAPVKDGVRNAFDYAYKHWAIIKKYGRFPHRNEMLGRESTPDELEFLKAGRGF